MQNIPSSYSISLIITLSSYFVNRIHLLKIFEKSKVIYNCIEIGLCFIFQIINHIFLENNLI